MSPAFLHAAATLTDFNLCNELYSLIEDRYGYPILADKKLPEEMRCVWEIWSSSGFIQGEGLARYFELEANREGLIDAYQIIGMPEQAEILQLFVPHLPTAGAMQLTKESLCTICGITLEELDDAQTTFFRQEESMTKNLATYIRSRLNQFEGLPLRDPKFSDSLPNVAYLGSAHSWIRKFASKNGGKIPTFSELKESTGHVRLKKASPSDYEILLQGLLTDYTADEALLRYAKPILSHSYYVTVGGKVRRD